MVYDLGLLHVDASPCQGRALIGDDEMPRSGRAVPCSMHAIQEPCQVQAQRVGRPDSVSEACWRHLSFD